MAGKMSKLVSILIPAYNSQKWIKETIHSALAQTWPNKEIIIVNDGSTDHTLSIAKQLKSKLVKVISQENRGATAARNKALEYAQGDYIQWLDSDDLLSPNKVSEQMKVSAGDRNDMTLYSAPQGTFYWRVERAQFVSNLLWQDLTPIEWLIYKFEYGLWINPVGWLVSRRLTDNVGPWDERLTVDDDGEYFSRAITKSEGIKFVPEARYYYRQSGFNQVSRQNSEKAHSSMILSRKLSIQNLRSLENSERTRRASVIYLQRLYGHLYPNKVELLNDLEALAVELGGKLTASSAGWKLKVIRNFFGWKTAKKVIISGRKLRLAMTVKWDEILYRLNRTSHPEKD